MKQGFIGAWQRYHRALKQRNAALKQRDAADDGVLDSLDAVLVGAADPVNEQRVDYAENLSETTKILLSALAPAFPPLEIHYRPGWSGDSLAEYLANHRRRDRQLETTTAGPHRAELVLASDGHKARDRLSRGQQKILSLALHLAQAEGMRAQDKQPLLLLDDLGSELDQAHLSRCLALLSEWGVQVWLTSVDDSVAMMLVESDIDLQVFHVEQGRITVE